MLNSKKAMIIIFLIYLIPGVPKDLCNYAAGLSNMKFKPFLLVSILGRTPGMMGSIIIGRQLYTHSYTSAIIIGVAASICFVLGIIYRNKVNGFLDNMYDKYLEQIGKVKCKVKSLAKVIINSRKYKSDGWCKIESGALLFISTCLHYYTFSKVSILH